MGNNTRRRPPRPIRNPPCSGLNASTRASSDKRSTEDANGVLWRKAPRPAETMNSAPRAAGPTSRSGSCETLAPVPLETSRRMRPSATSHTARPMSVPRVDLPTIGDDQRERRHQERTADTEIAPHADQRPHHDRPAHRRKRKEVLTSKEPVRAWEAGNPRRAHRPILAQTTYRSENSDRPQGLQCRGGRYRDGLSRDTQLL